jgi:hypothetical protein
MGAFTTALSDWSATIGGTTAVSIRSERMLATTSEDARTIIGWRCVCERGPAFVAELRSTLSGITGSRINDVSESAASNWFFSVTPL